MQGILMGWPLAPFTVPSQSPVPVEQPRSVFANGHMAYTDEHTSRVETGLEVDLRCNSGDLSLRECATATSVVCRSRGCRGCECGRCGCGSGRRGTGRRDSGN